MRSRMCLVLAVMPLVLACVPTAAVDSGAFHAERCTVHGDGCGPVVPQNDPTLPAPDLLTYRGDAARTGAMPGPGPSGVPGIRWTYRAGAPIQSQPAVVAGVVFLTSWDGGLHAIDLMTGNPRWNVSLGAAVASSPTVTDGMIIVGAEDGVHARSMTDGEPTWFTATPDPVLGSIAASGDVAFAATAAGSVMAIDARTGAARWTREVGGLVDTSVAVGARSVVVGTTTGVVVALDPATGAELWRLETGDLARVGTPAIADGRVYIATLDGDPGGAHHLFALDLSTGAVIWRMASPGGEAAYTPVVMDGHVITQGEDGHVTALDPSTGLPLWQVEAPGPVEIVPAMVDGTVYGASNGGFAFAVDAETATERWRVPIKGIPYGTGVVAGFVLVGTDIGDLYAIGGADP